MVAAIFVSWVKGFRPFAKKVGARMTSGLRSEMKSASLLAWMPIFAAFAKPRFSLFLMIITFFSWYF